MKARIINTPVEVEVQPYFPEGMFAGFTDVTGKLQPGMVVYRPSDLEFEEYKPLPKSVDWDAFRREAALYLLPLATQMCDYRGYREECVKEAIRLTDELIKQLKES